jgi:hypothetical protein
VGFGAFAVVGAILVEQAGHRIGWIGLAIGLGGALTAASQGYVIFAADHPGTIGAPVAAALGAFVGAPATALIFTFLPLLFPDGHLPSPRWRPVAWLAVADVVVFTIAFGLTPQGLFGAVENPLAIIPPGRPSDLVVDLAGALTSVAGVLCAGALIVRYRSADAVTRQQLKWVALAVAVFAASLAASIALPPLDTFTWTLPVLPIAVGIAILHYRLYDIDVLISRALVYVPLTALLGGLYAASVALFQRLFVGITGETSDGAIVLTTLILAGAFTPARKALEGAVERRWKPAPATPAVATGTAPRPAAGTEPAAREPAGDAAALDARIADVARAIVREELAAWSAGRGPDVATSGVAPTPGSGADRG